MTSATTAATRYTTPAPIQTARAPIDIGEHAGRGHREPEHGVVRAHDRRERAAAVLIGRAALDEQPVADDDRAVPGGATDHERDGEPDRAAQRCSAPPDSHEHDRADVVPPEADLAERRRAEEAPDREPDAARGDERAEPDVARVERVLREDDLGDVDRGRADERDVPDDEHRAERASR